MRKIRRTGMVLLVCLLALTACKEEKKQVTLTPVEETQSAEREDEAQVVVHVCGAVRDEGVYELPLGSRVYEAIEMAGGFTRKAAKTQMNLAEILEDEAYLYVPTKAEAGAKDSDLQVGIQDGKVNLNTATREELMTLSGVGEAKADLIIQYREEHGRFHKIEDVMNISGIKEGLFAKIKEDITV